ncbi:exopolysaccharide biosynthesis polyprenyl glycosylphosphotransferase [Mycolicibacterium rhodesiae NBB3]|uniref:Exopolysaccharide biosynthesis polyprenyl glycosylphosphotransferase n=1 Tax=Mycolicibacterium rhodesiae (strain NBB3) TaxID=710685 RepID=G8RYA5_MYCRN|nr:sugar transferase [Mycolicibacterium rhodesiae]AEV71996.1 exopolysaccharide biosynthesis polyprenyl glycosylphosphotransferase [Mycolicibacterium rhodesiae NBB3]
MTARTEPLGTRPGGPAPVSDARTTVATGENSYRIGRNEKVVGIALDTVSAAVSVALGVWWSSATEPVLPPIWMTALFVPIVILLFAVQSLYRHKLGRNFIDELGPIETNVALAAVLVLVIMTLSGAPHTAGAVISKTWVCAAVLVPLPRLFHAMIQKRMRKSHHFMTPTIIVGSGVIANRIIERLQTFPEYGLEPIGLLETEGADAESHPDIPVIGTADSIAAAITATGAGAVLIAFAPVRDERLIRVVRVAHRHKVRVWVVPRMFDAVGERAGIEHLGGLPLLALPNADPHGWQFSVKHVIDRVGAGLGLLAISPLMLTLILLVRLSSPGPIFFGQERIGRDGKVFKCLKFRSMRPPRASDADFELKASSAPGGVEGVDRRTGIGKLMRRTSLDELPQLINVLKGDMSLVGPRPERPEFVEFFEIQIHRYGERHRVKAGMTGWAQVHGLRGQTSIADRVEWDNYYIENWSLALDLKILLLTVKAVVQGAE